MLFLRLISIIIHSYDVGMLGDGGDDEKICIHTFAVISAPEEFKSQTSVINNSDSIHIHIGTCRQIFHQKKNLSCTSNLDFITFVLPVVIDKSYLFTRIRLLIIANRTFLESSGKLVA
jgi:hypothetical protein